MGHYRLICSCGYESNDSLFGVEPFGHEGFATPVVVNGDCRLHTVFTDDKLFDELDSKAIDEAIRKDVRDRYGETAIAANPMLDIAYQCPKCGQMTAKFEFTGF